MNNPSPRKAVYLEDVIEAIRKVAPSPTRPDDVPYEVELVWGYLRGATDEVEKLPTFTPESPSWIRVEDGETSLEKELEGLLQELLFRDMGGKPYGDDCTQNAIVRKFAKKHGIDLGSNE